FSMARQGSDFLTEKNPMVSLYLFKKAMLFPFKNLMKEIAMSFYYNLSIAYRDMNDADNQAKYLKIAINEKEDFWQAYDALGMVYFKWGYWPIAKEMFEKAIKFGDNNVAQLQSYIAQIEKVDMKEQYSTIFNEATQLISKGNFEKAMDIYEFLMDKNYEVAAINKNIGGYYLLHQNDFKNALKYFQKSKESSKTNEIYLYVAFAYYKLGQNKNALAILKEGLSLFPDDSKLTGLYDQIE